jgi:hypothetical protein
MYKVFHLKCHSAEVGERLGTRIACGETARDTTSVKLGQ